MTPLIDQYLLFRLRTKRDPEAFAKLYDRYVEAMYRFAALKLPTEEDAQDVTSETFLKTWAYIADGGEVTHFRAFLYRTARNLIADRYRKTEFLITLPVTNEPVEPSTQVQADIGDRGRGGATMQARAEYRLLQEQLGRLKEDYRDVVLLRLVDDLPFEMIGEILGKQPGHVRVIYHRALKLLKEIETNA